MTRLALITGGAKGIGRAITRGLSADGYDVVVTGRDGAALESEASYLSDLGRRAYTRTLDVRDPESVRAVFAEVENTLGTLNVLVNCAGIIIRKDTVDYADDDWLSVIETDLNGAFWCSRAAAPGMLGAGRGSIVNVSSIVGSTGLAGRASYASAKAGLEGLTRTLAVEWAGRGVRVNAIAPGWTLTEMVAAGFESGNLDRAAMERRIPMRRLAATEEIAAAALFLASDAASYITGQVLTVDGGITINGDIT